MFDRDALKNEWIKAAEAYKVFEEASEKANPDGSYSEREALDAVGICNEYGYRWGNVWDLFEKIGMSVKEVNGAV